LDFVGPILQQNQENCVLHMVTNHTASTAKRDIDERRVRHGSSHESDFESNILA